MSDQTAKIVRGARWTVKKLIVKPIISPIFSLRDALGNIGSTAKHTKAHINEIRTQNRDPWAEGAPDMSDFKQVLHHWGIEEHEIKGVLDGLKTQLFIFSCLGCWGGYLLTGTSILAKGYALPLIFVGIIVIITRYWRIQCLKKRKFVFFKDWLFGGIFSGIGKETPIARAKRLDREARHE